MSNMQWRRSLLNRLQHPIINRVSALQSVFTLHLYQTTKQRESIDLTAFSVNPLLSYSDSSLASLLLLQVLCDIASCT